MIVLLVAAICIIQVSVIVYLFGYMLYVIVALIGLILLLFQVGLNLLLTLLYFVILPIKLHC